MRKIRVLGQKVYLNPPPPSPAAKIMAFRYILITLTTIVVREQPIF